MGGASAIRDEDGAISGGASMRQKIDADADQHGGGPAAAVDIFLEEDLPAMALVTSVSEAEAGATRLRFRWLSAKSSEKKASARKPTPAKKSGQVRTARMAPFMPEWARISSRSPMDFMAAAVSTSPAVEQNNGRDHGGGGPEARMRGRGRMNRHRGLLGSFRKARAAQSVDGVHSPRSPRPMVMSAIPAQRSIEIGSWSQKRASSATITLPKAVAGSTKVRSAQESAVR
jgi:hypothetical protein